MILNTCQANWVLGKNDDCWTIADQKGNLLITLPPGLNEVQVNDIRRFAMKYEELAYYEGRKHEAHNNKFLVDNDVAELSNQVLLLSDQNEQLSQNLQRAIGEMEDT